MNEFSRSELLLGKENIEKLKKSNIILFGLGGVGSYVAEGLVRCGVENITLVDNDVVSVSNINRQLIALHSTIGRYKTEVLAERIKDINPSCKVLTHNLFYLPENADKIDLSGYDYIIDAIDTVTAKINIICRAKELNVPVISCMGTGNKLDPTKLLITDIYKTSVCPLCRVMRKELRGHKIKNLDVLYSEEVPKKPEWDNPRIPGSVSFVPSVAGLMIAGYVIKKLLENE